MTKLPRITADDMIRALSRNGWYEVRQKGSHRVFRHPSKQGHVSVPYHRGRVLKTGTMDSILERAGLSPEELRSLL